MKKQVRVAQIVGRMNGGGVEAVVMNYYRHIDHNVIQFDFIVETDSKMVPREEIKSLGGHIFMVPSLKYLSSYTSALGELFLRIQWPIVHSHINALSVFPLRVAKQAGIPVRIAHSHSTSGKGEYIKNTVKYCLRCFSNKYSTHRFACGQYAGEWLFGQKADFEIIRNAIDLDLFVFNPLVRKRTRDVLNIADNQFVIGHVGRFLIQKNHGFLIDMFERVCRYRDDVILLLVGDGDLLPSVKHRVVERGLTSRVRFLGQRTDVDCLYQAFDAFALPSLYEGLCVVGVEAQRAGLPCFFSDAISKEVDLAGEVTFLSTDHVDDWIHALCKADRNNRNSCRLLSCFDKYDIKLASQDLCEKYKKMLETRS